VTEIAESLLADKSLRHIQSEIERRHDESVERLQEWVKRPALAAEDRGMDEGCDLMMRMARDAGFQKTARIDTDGTPASSPRSMRAPRRPSRSTSCTT